MRISRRSPPTRPANPASWHPSRSSAWTCDEWRESSCGSGCQNIPLVTMPQANWVAKTLQSICMVVSAFFFDCAEKEGRCLEFRFLLCDLGEFRDLTYY